MSDKGIYEAIGHVMREIGAIGKDSKNKEQSYNYRSAEAVYNRVQPLFAKHGIFSAPCVIAQTRETGQTKAGRPMHYSILTVEHTFYCTDGSSVQVTTVGEGMDAGDKASNKALTASHKYAICMLLNIPYELHDPDSTSPEFHKPPELRKVTAAEIAGLVDAWKTAFPKIAEMDEVTRKSRFSEWTEEITGRAFNVRVMTEWTRDDLTQCLESIPTD